MNTTLPILIVVMGVSGCGKTTVGRALAARWGCVFLDADDYHPSSNIQKMSGGTPLTDKDRVGWVDAICEGVREQSFSPIVLACSALTQRVQEGLARLPHRLIYVHLTTETVDMQARLRTRDHFMPVELLQSQYQALSVPQDAIEFDAGLPLQDLLPRISDAVGAIFPTLETQ